jgi:hypothetical protein
MRSGISHIQIGDTAESNFNYRCISLGYTVCTPVNSKTIYDVILDTNSKMYKVQIKCSSIKPSNRGYKVNIQRGSQQKYKYSEDDIDMFAIYIIQEDDWYLIPFSVLKDKHNLRPRRGGVYEIFRNAFHLL